MIDWKARATAWAASWNDIPSDDEYLSRIVTLLEATHAEGVTAGAEAEQRRILERIDGNGPGDDIEIILKAYMRGLGDGTRAGTTEEREMVVGHLERWAAVNLTNFTEQALAAETFARTIKAGEHVKGSGE